MTLTTGIERFHVRNFRVLRDVELAGLTPVTALLGPNGSGKSTVFSALSFLTEAFRDGLATTWEARGGISEIATRGGDGPVEFDLTCRIDGATGRYRLVIGHQDDAPVVTEELLTWQLEGDEAVFEVLKFSEGLGTVSRPGSGGRREEVELATRDVLAVGVASQLSANAEVAQFHRFVREMVLSELEVDAIRQGTKKLNRRTLRPSGDNLGSVVERLRLEQPNEWAEIAAQLRRYVPGFDDIEPLELGNGGVTVQLREEGAATPIPPENISDGTLRLAGLLVALRTAHGILLIEEPEEQVHPRLHYLLADAIRSSAVAGQVIVATHAPQFVDALRPDEVWMLFRDDSGTTATRRAADIPRLTAMVDAGGLLGNLWNEGFFDVGDPLAEPG